jgi:hypothetical protein
MYSYLLVTAADDGEQLLRAPTPAMLSLVALSACSFTTGPVALKGASAFRRPAMSVRTAPVLAQRPRSRRVVALQGPPPPAPDEEEDDKLLLAYRTLGISEDATYDEITDAHIELTERYADDEVRIQRLDEAKDLVVSEQLRKRMSGELRPRVAASPWDEKPKQREMPWVPVLRFLRKFIRLPGFGHIKAVTPMFTILFFMPWFAPTVVGSVTLLSCVAGVAFTYNRGQADVPKDEWGQIGEIRPVKSKPMLMTLGCCAATYWTATHLAKRAVVGMVGAPRGLDAIIKTTFLCIGFFLQALIIDVHAVSD